MEIFELPPTRLDLPGGEEPAYIATQRWALEPWQGEDPPELGPTWSRKGKFSVNGSRSCAELAVLHHLRDEGWHGIWVNAYGPGELRSDWFPAPAAKTIIQTDAPPWAAEIFEDLRAVNSGKLGGFFDVFAWREPGEVRFDEVKVGRDPIGINQHKFVKLALDLGHRLDEFTIIKVPGRPQREVDGSVTFVDTDQPHEPDLEEQLRQAIEDYKATWSTVDSELYDLCHRRPGHRSFADVYAKSLSVIDSLI